MKNEALVKEWFYYASMDFDTAVYLHKNMIPEPLEIVCYHCQQSAEKFVKGLLVGYGLPIPKTHDVGIAVCQLESVLNISDEIMNACESLTPYAVKVRYPREILIEEYHVRNAIKDATIICDWSKKILSGLSLFTVGSLI